MPTQITISGDPLPPGTYTINEVVVPPPPPPPPLKPPYPTGKGMFIWHLNQSSGGDPLRLADECLAQGFKHIYLKVTDGEVIYNGDVGRHVTILNSVGIEVWGWGYIYGRVKNRNPVREAIIAAKRVNYYGLRGWVVNAEVEFRPPLGDSTAAAVARQDAIDYCDRLQLDLPPNMPVGLSSFRYPRLHPTFTWPEFLRICTFHSPQVYWIEAMTTGAPAFQLGKSIEQLKERKNLPIIPTGVASMADPPSSWRPTVAQLDNFYAGVVANNLPGWNWWAYEHAQRVPEWWQAIRQHGS